jgi:tetratricopeptide (TPR) repeat protein
MAREALAQIDRAEADHRVIGSRLDAGVAASIRGRAHLLLGDVEEAAVQAAQALQFLGPSEHVDRVTALILLGDVGVARYHRELAEDAYDEARLILSNMEQSRATARLWRDLGDSLRDFDDLHGAMSAYDWSLQMVGLTRSPSFSKLRMAS